MSSYSMAFRGSVYAILSALVFAASATIGKQLLKAQIPTSNLLFWRYGISVLLVFLILIYRRKNLNFDKKAMFKAFLAAIFFYSGSTFCYFESFHYIDTGISSAICTSCATFFVIIYVWLIDKQQFKIPYFISFTLLLVGILMTVQNNDNYHHFRIEGVFISIVSGLLYAFYLVSNRSKVSNLDPLLSSLMLFSGNSLIFLIWSLNTGDIVVPTDFYLVIKIIIMAAVFTVLPIFLLLKALRYISAADVAIISVLRPVFVILLGLLLLNESLNGIKIIGLVLIISAGIINQWDKFQKTV